MTYLLWWLTACSSPVASSAPPVVDGRMPAVVAEGSSLVASTRQPGVFWTHNDSGDGARIFAVSGRGELLAEVAVQGARAVDWEAITLDDRGNLWIGDIGNNDNGRRDLTVYWVPEPTLGATTVPVGGKVTFHYPDQTAFPDAGQRNFDAESLFWADGMLWLASKHRSDTLTTLYRFPALEGDVTLERVDSFDVGGATARYGGMVTDADVHPSGRYLALLTYHALFVFERPEDGRSWFQNLVHSVPFEQSALGQCEGIAWDGWSLLVTNEGRAIHRAADPFRQASLP